MTRIQQLLPILMIMLGLTTLVMNSALAADGNVARMASILSHLNHYPSSDEKAALAKMAADKGHPDAVRSIARAMMNLRHQVSAGDRKRLDSIAQNPSQPQDIRLLAAILAKLNHKPDRKDLSILRQIAH